jgi:competence protein ComEC
MGPRQTYRFPFAKYPAVRLALLFIAGILLDDWLCLSVIFWLAIFGCLLPGCLYLEYHSSRAIRTAIYRTAIFAYLILVVLFGAVWNAVHTRLWKPPPALSQTFEWEDAVFHGDIAQVRTSSTGKYHLDVEVDSTVFGDSLVWIRRYKLRAILQASDSLYVKTMKPGSHVVFEGTVYPLEGKRNPHEFNYKGYLASQGIHTQVGIDTVRFIGEPEAGLSWTTLRRYVLNLIDHNFSSQTSPLAKALLLGYKNELSREEKLAFSRAGLSHIMAVSGLHVGFILAPFWLLVPLFWTLRWGKPIGLMLVVLLLFGYAGLTGFTASVVRASVTGGFIMYGRLFHKVRDSKNLTALAALIILLSDPQQIYDIGFQLSFSAVYIILLIMPVINDGIPLRLRHRWYAKPLMIVLVSLVVQAGLYPLLTYYFGEFSLAGPLVNALVVPPLTLVVPFALLLLPVSYFFPAAGAWLNTPNQYLLQWLEDLVVATASMEGSWISTHISSPFIFLVWIGAVSVLATLNMPRLRWKFTCLLLALLCLWQGSEIYQKLQPPRLQITVFDVGQGDAALIRTPLGRHLLIDAGRWTPGYNSARQVIVPHLKAIGIKKLDAVLLSHPHADHIGGINELMQSVAIDTIYNAGFPYDSQLYHRYLRRADELHIPVRSLAAGDRLDLDPTMRLFVYGPDRIRPGSDPNEHSLVIEIVYGKTELLFTGDAGHAQEARLLEHFGPMIDTDLLKVGHHGSRTSSSAGFLQTATPRHAVVSLGRNNRFGHPHPEAIRRIRRWGAKMYFTSLDKALIFYSDGDSIIPKNWE